MPKNKPYLGVDWDLRISETGGLASWDEVNRALLMDIRSELQSLNRLLNCSNFLGIPKSLREISGNTKKRVRVKKNA